MILKKAKYKKIRVWDNKQISPEVCGCDSCKKEIIGNDLRISTWAEKDSSKTSENIFCSWKCLFDYLPKIKSNYFVSMPFLHFDETGKGSAEELIQLVKSISKTDNNEK